MAFFEHTKSCKITTFDGLWQSKHREWLIHKLEHVFIFTEFNETVLERERGSKPDESQRRGRAAGRLLAEITLSLIATVEWSCQRITGTAWDYACSAGSDEHKVPLTCSYLTGLLSASRALCLLDCQTGKKKQKKNTSLQADSSIVIWTDKGVKAWWMCGRLDRDCTEEMYGLVGKENGRCLPVDGKMRYRLATVVMEKRRGRGLDEPANHYFWKFRF